MNNTRSDIEFGYGSGISRIDFAKESGLGPTTTLLQYLRSRSDSKGTKEGCAEGDCGACTVVLGEINEQGGMDYVAVDSCLIFLPQIHGKHLITVESIGKATEMHPVQQAMVDTGGSQCGYCTPGFIMSLFALYKQGSTPSRSEIDDALTGNLCRCTGYRPIVEAAAQSCAKLGAPQDIIAKGELEMLKQLKQIAENSQILEIQNESQVYFRPQSLLDALKLRREHSKAILINGTTDIGLLVTKQKRVLPVVIDLSGVNELRQVDNNSELLSVGAGVSLEKVKGLSEDEFRAMFDMLAVFGSRQIRNRATFGGNVGTASPIGDTPPVLMAYDAEVVLVRLTENSNEKLQRRTAKVADFINGYRSTILKKDELIETITIRKNQAAAVKAYKISKRKDLDISTVSAGFRLAKTEGKVSEIKLYYGGMAATTQRAAKAEEFLLGKDWSRANVESAMDLVEADFTPISDARSGKEGRRIMARNLLLKFWSETSD